MGSDKHPDRLTLRPLHSVTVLEVGAIHRAAFSPRYWSSKGCLFHHAYPVGFRAAKARRRRRRRPSPPAPLYPPLPTSAPLPPLALVVCVSSPAYAALRAEPFCRQWSPARSPLAAAPHFRGGACRCRADERRACRR